MSKFLRGLKRKVYEILHELEVESVQIILFFFNDGNIKILASVQIYFQVWQLQICSVKFSIWGVKEFERKFYNSQSNQAQFLFRSDVVQ